MRFTKMQGIGNDYVYVNGFEEPVDDASGLARLVSDRHFGIGSDGLILVLPSDEADVRMRMFNADGSEAEMCGNGIRCVAKYAWDHGLSRANPMRVETGGGVKMLSLYLDDRELVDRVRVDMGEPVLTPADIPARLDGDRIIDQPLDLGDQRFDVTCVSMGNPHAVVYCDDIQAVALETLGPRIETHEAFPSRINAHFVQVHDSAEVFMRTWERGSGVTLACGTGASAVGVAGVLTGRSGRDVLVHLPGGDLQIQWDQGDNHVYMTGPAREVFRGEWSDSMNGNKA